MLLFHGFYSQPLIPTFNLNFFCRYIQGALQIALNQAIFKSFHDLNPTFIPNFFDYTILN